MTVESTVQDPAVPFPTDGKLRNRSRVRRVNRVVHARPLRRRNRPIRRLRTSLGRLVRDMERKASGREDLRPVFADERAMDRRNVLRRGAGHHQRRTLRRLQFSGRWIWGLGGGICDVLRVPERPGTTARWQISASESGSVPPLVLAAP